MGSEEAFEAALTEGTSNVVLTSDLAFSKALTVNHDMTLDLGGHTIISDLGKKDYFLIADGAILTLKGEGSITSGGFTGLAQNGGEIIVMSGQYVSELNSVFRAEAGSRVTVLGGEIHGREGGLTAMHGGELVVDDGTITGVDNFAIATNGKEGFGGNTIVINGGTMIGNIETANYEACGVYIANDDIFIMNGGTIIANGGAGIVMRAGNVIINDGVIEATGNPGTTGKVADDPTLMSKSGIIYHEQANYPGKAGMSLAIYGGTITGVDHAVEVLSNEETPNVTIEGGNFTPPYPEEAA